MPASADSAQPLVTVVMPSLNQGRFIAAAIDSVLDQGYPRLELVVVDGGSTDGTLERLRGYGERIRWVSEPDAGQAAAVNKGVGMGHASILGWLNADDCYEPGALTRVVRHFAAQPGLMLVYGDARFVDEQGRELGPCRYVEPFDLGRLVHYGDVIAQPAAFFRREAFQAVSGLDESLHWAMDYDLWLKIGKRFPVAYVAEPLACYRLTGENKTTRGGQARFDEIAAVGRRHGARGLPAAFRVERMAAALRTGASLLRRGLPLPAARELLLGVVALATSPRAWGIVVRARLARLVHGRGVRRPGEAGP